MDYIHIFLMFENSRFLQDGHYHTTVLVYILLGLPGLWSSVPKLETGAPKLQNVSTGRVKLLASRINPRPTECPTQPRRMIDASRVYTFI